MQLFHEETWSSNAAHCKVHPRFSLRRPSAAAVQLPSPGRQPEKVLTVSSRPERSLQPARQGKRSRWAERDDAATVFAHRPTLGQQIYAKRNDRFS
jgi:hypothetical protein